MRRLLLLLAVAAVSAALAQTAAAGTASVAVSMSISEPVVQTNGRNCPVFPDGFCGSGVFLPFGKATDSILFGGGCDGACDLRTVTVPGGSIVMDETFSNGSCPGSCHPTPSEPASGTLTDVVVGGTGIFAGATGTLSGSVTSAAAANRIKLVGTITLQT